MKLLVVEDGDEYSTTFARFLGAPFEVERAGHGAEALDRLARAPYALLFLDMRFDRLDPSLLLGDLAGTTERFDGDPVRARQFLEAHQGTYVLEAIRAAGHRLPALFSYDFDAEPRRWAVIAGRHAPVDYLPDNAAPSDIRARLLRLAGSTGR